MRRGVGLIGFRGLGGDEAAVKSPRRQAYFALLRVLGAPSSRGCQV